MSLYGYELKIVDDVVVAGRSVAAAIDRTERLICVCRTLVLAGEAKLVPIELVDTWPRAGASERAVLDCGYKVEIVGGRLLSCGKERDDVINHGRQIYEQAGRLSRQESIRLALSAGRAIESYITSSPAISRRRGPEAF